MVVFLSYIKLFRRSKILSFMLEYSQLKTMEKIMFWRLHKAIFADQMDKALEVIKELGDTCQVVSGTPSQLAEVPFFAIAQPTLAITTLQDAQRIIIKYLIGYQGLTIIFLVLIRKLFSCQLV
jgi:hypothetical protein